MKPALVKATELQTTRFTLFSKFEGGRVRRLKFDVNALADFEQETGMGFAQLMKQRAIFGTARAMAWAGLKFEDRGLTIEKVGELISKFITDKELPQDQRDINTILEVLFAAAVDQEALGFQRMEEPENTSDTPPTDPVTDPNASRATPDLEGQTVPSTGSPGSE